MTYEEEAKEVSPSKTKNTIERKMEQLYDFHDVDVDMRATKSKFPSLTKINSSKVFTQAPDVSNVIN